MGIPLTGSVSIGSIQTEFGGSNPASLSEYYVGEQTTIATGYGIPSAGPISLNSFRGSQSFILEYVTAINANALGTTAGGSVTVNIAATAGKFDRYVVIASGAAESRTILTTSEMPHYINGSPGTIIFDNGYTTDDDGHRVAMQYLKIGNNDTTVTIGWSAAFYTQSSSGDVVYFEPDRGHAIFVYVLCGIPTMGTVNHSKGAGGSTATMTLTGSTKRCAIFITVPNVAPEPTSMTYCVKAGSGLRLSSFYDVNMGDGTLTYTTDSLSGDGYGAFGGASFPY
jgi:hypothetical protein